MPETSLSFIFPAFTRDYSDHPGHNLPGFEEQFSQLLQTGAETVDSALSDFNFNGQTFPEDELRTQYLTYIYSCAASVILRKHHFNPLYTAGYSMGIYAAMFDAGVVSFETGLELIKLAYHSMLDSLMNGLFGMGILIGLNNEDIRQLIDHSGLRIEITNQNAPHSFVVSGFREDLMKLLEYAKEEGALHVRDLGVSLPYHSRFLKEGAMDFARRISHLKFSSQGNLIVSLIDQTILVTAESMRYEVPVTSFSL